MGKPLAVVLGVVAAVIGALIWAYIMGGGYELAILAIGIGAAIGLAMRIVGGEGVALGAIAAGLTIASICMGKIVGVNWAMEKDAKEEMLTLAYYNETVVDAEDFRSVSTEGELREFMVSHGFTDAPSAQAITDIEIQDFRTYSAPDLERFASRSPSFEQWQDYMMDDMYEILDEVYPRTQRLKDTLGFLDIVFFLAGIATAFKMVAAIEE